MQLLQTNLLGAFLVNFEKKSDTRGFFLRTFCAEEFKKNALECNFVQDSFSYTEKKGTIRGMHYQKAPYEEIKLVQCIQGSIYDVIIDLRKNSPTYKGWFSTILSAEKNNALYVPKGFAHGLQTLTNNAMVNYKISTPFSPKNATGIRWDDPSIKIKWPLPLTVISDKDKNLPFLS